MFFPSALPNEVVEAFLKLCKKDSVSFMETLLFLENYLLLDSNPLVPDFHKMSHILKQVCLSLSICNILVDIRH